ncbi:MAG: hypothetical protein J5937_00510, partial [Paludibacteraceae bacterium]|nr:hypothetical protein [Paludibacteraceae bacterium]
GKASGLPHQQAVNVESTAAKNNQISEKTSLLYDLRVDLYDLRMLFQKKAVPLCVHLISNTQIIVL